MKRCSPVKYGWQAEQMPIRRFGTVEIVLYTAPQVQVIVVSVVLGWMFSFMVVGATWSGEARNAAFAGAWDRDVNGFREMVKGE